MKNIHMIAYHQFSRKETFRIPQQNRKIQAKDLITEEMIDLILKKHPISIKNTEYGEKHCFECYVFTPKEIKEIIKKARKGERINL